MYKSVTSLSPKSLRDLAAALDWHSPQMVARRDLSPESIDELALMLLAYKKPTVGWWQRHRLTSSYTSTTCYKLSEAQNYFYDTGVPVNYGNAASSVNTIPEAAVR